VTLPDYSDDARFLYRGVNPDLYAITGGQLVPKDVGPFEYTFMHDGTVKHDGSATFGPSEQNAVLRHELDQEGFPTSGISTTPHLVRASHYATAEGKYPKGHVFKIDRTLLLGAQVKEYVVAQWLPFPSAPEDDEVILVAHDCGPLPMVIVNDILEVVA
jgi:hypothetical protein